MFKCFTLFFFLTSIYGGNFPKIVSSHLEEMEDYLANFPTEKYAVRHIQSNHYNGSFYIDKEEDVIKGFLSIGVQWEQHISEIISLYARPGTTVLDIGSHIGTHTLTMSQSVGPEGSVIAFEPQPKIFRELVKNIQLNNLQNVTCYWGAIGNEIGSIEIPYLTQGNEGGTNLIETSLRDGNWIQSVVGGTGIVVDLRTVDSLSLENVSFIKLDVEQMENAALEGAKETITRNKPIILLEIKGGSAFEYSSPEIQEEILFTIQLVEDLGYKVQRIGWWDYLATPL